MRIELGDALPKYAASLILFLKFHETLGGKASNRIGPMHCINVLLPHNSVVAALQVERKIKCVN